MDLGLDFLMNPKKKQNDNISVSSEPITNSNYQQILINDKTPSIESFSASANPFMKRKESSTSSSSSSSYETESSVSEIRNPNFNNFKKNVQSSDSDSEIQSIGIDSMKEKYQSEEDIILMKKELLYQFERLEKRGYKLPKKFTLGSSLEEMKMEYERIKRDKAVDASIKLQRRILLTTTSGIEWLNSKFDPIGAKLDGWSDSIYESIDDYDDIFEELYIKYASRSEMPPELKLLMMLGGSAFMHHMTNSMFKSQLPGLDEILKQNPELAKNLAAATANHMSNQQDSANNLFGSLGNMFSGMFGTKPQPQPQPQNDEPNIYEVKKQAGVKMRGPNTDVDELLKEFENNGQNDNDRIEVISEISESELSSLTIDDDVSSIAGVVSKKKGVNKKRNGKITLNI